MTHRAATSIALAATLTTLGLAAAAASLVGARDTEVRLCDDYAGIPPGWPQNPAAGMVQVRLQGADGRRRRLRVDATEVTNAQFAAFVAATGYHTQAEQAGASAVFVKPGSGVMLHGAADWWTLVEGAYWRAPEGPGSTLEGRMNQPVVHVTRADAQAYAAWHGTRLPTEAEWEAAAGASAPGSKGEPRDRAGQPLANYWQGLFPYGDNAEDGFSGRAAVGCYTANASGVFDAIGNVWEWTADDFGGDSQWHGHGDPVAAVHAGLIKGGSYLCAETYCARYRSTARHSLEIDLGTSHVGFRTVRDG